MSNNNGKIFIMKILKFLIVLEFIQLCVSMRTNVTIYNETRDALKSLRSKRQVREYTRWRSNIATPLEFIVKVDDEGFNPTTTTSSEIVAINIQPLTKTREKIIIGGALVPPFEDRLLEETPAEYTRFVIPAITTTKDNDNVIHPPHIKAIQEAPVAPFTTARPNVDELVLPAKPQFISRIPPSVQQYAPITPVAFYRPLTPSTVYPKSDLYSPSRSPLPPIITPTRSEMESKGIGGPQAMDDYKDEFEQYFLNLENDETHNEMVTRTSSTVIVTSTQNIDEETEVIPTKTTTVNDSDTFHNMFYNDEDNEIRDSRRKNAEPSESEDYGKTDKNIKENVLNDTEEENNGVDNVTNESGDKNEDLKPSSSTRTDRNFTLNVTATLSFGTEMPTIQIHRTPQRCSLRNIKELSFSSPRTLHEIVTQLKKWSERSPIATVVDITANNLTTMDNPIYMMKVDDPSTGQVVSAKDIVMVVAGIQGRDHHAVTAAMYVLYQLIERTEAHSDLLNRYRFWIIPVFNPDGYDYSLTFVQRREWTKNLRQSWEDCNGQPACRDCETYGLRCTPTPCYGVNLDRNFEYQWIPAEELKTEHPCGELYAGQRQLSERETRALTNFLHEQKTPISMFVAFKEGDVLGVMYPYSHTRKRRAFDQTYRKRASRAASAAFSISGRPYVAGQTSEFLPLYAGGIEDWVDGHLGIDNTYTIMMFRPSDFYNSKLMTENVVHEAYAALDTLLLESGQTIGTEVQMLRTRSRTAATEPGPSLVVAAAILIFNS